MPTRRRIISYIFAFSGVGLLGGIAHWLFKRPSLAPRLDKRMVKKIFPLGFQWQTVEPFLFCVHHDDQYPRGMANFGPDKQLLSGRDIGQDFEPKDGFRMYHGDEVPGFPVHPHRGFETITIVRQGYIDHADSLGAAGRYGNGDVQWMTAGNGVQHSEMFPLLKKDAENPVELFQIWLNLPRKSKKVPAHFAMFWSEKIPKAVLDSGKVAVNVIAGQFENLASLPTPPDSWAADPANEVSILLIKMSEGGQIQIPNSKSETNRVLYFFAGKEIEINGQRVTGQQGVQLDSSVPLDIRNPNGTTELLLLQAKSIGEPVVQHGPFVMNTREEIVQTFQDYQRTQFGGWPWQRRDMVHGPVIERFAKYPDGRIEKPT